jgi:hypothetical protein
MPIDKIRFVCACLFVLLLLSFGVGVRNADTRVESKQQPTQSGRLFSLNGASLTTQFRRADITALHSAHDKGANVSLYTANAFKGGQDTSPNPIDDAEFFVRQHYIDFLNRQPDPGGLSYWTHQITQCGSDATCVGNRRAAVSAAFFIEMEFQHTGFFIYRLYQASLGLQPTYNQYFLDRNANSLSSEAEVLAYAETFVQRPEFLQKYPATMTGAQFLDALLATAQQSSGVDLTSRTDDLKLEYILGHTQAESRARSLRKLVEYPEFMRAEYNPAFVLTEYFGYLRRDPEPGGYAFWLDVLNNKDPNNYLGVVNAFITSDEYRARFGTQFFTVTPAQGQAGVPVIVNLNGQFTNFHQGVTRANFGPGISVGGGTDGGPGLVTVISKTSATAALLISATAVPGPRTVTIETGGEQLSLANGFTVLPNPATLVTIQPDTASRGQNLTVIVTGQNTHFNQGTTQASFGAGIGVGGGTPGGFGPVTVINSTSLTVQLAIDAAAPLGVRTVVVQTGTEQAMLADGFHVTVPPAVIESVNPNNGHHCQIISVTITGQFTDFVQGSTQANFGPGISVGGATAGAFGPVTVTSPTTATAQLLLPAQVELGSRSVIVKTGAQELPLNDGFAVVEGQPTPTVLTITSPSSGTTFSAQPISVQGTIENSVALAGVTVNGVPATVSNGHFSANNVPLARDGNNIITALSDDPGCSTGQSSVMVTLDTTPPSINIDSQTDGFTTSDETIAVSGFVSDIVTPNPIVTVNGVNANVSNGTFIAMGIPLNPGSNQLTAAARDGVGNVSTATVSVNRTELPGLRLLIQSGQAQSDTANATLPTPLMVKLVNTDGEPVINREIQFNVSHGDGTIKNVPLINGQTAERHLIIQTDANGLAAVQYTLGSRTGAGNNRVQASVSGGLSTVEFCATATSGTPNRIAIVPMSNQQTGAVGQPLGMPFACFVLDVMGNPVSGVPVTFSVAEGEGNLSGNQTITVNTGADGTAHALLTLGPEAGTQNNAVAAAYQGQTDPPILFAASGRALGQVADTTFTGIVLDNGDRPLRNVRASIFGTNRAALTDEQGHFMITNVPPGAQRLFLDGSAITDTLGRIFPNLEFDLNVISGVNNSLPMPVYLPPLTTDPHSVATITGPVTTQIVLQMPGVPEATLTLLPGTIVSNHDGPASASHPITVRLSRVNSDRVPMPPPNGSVFMLAGTVQPSGTHFSPPAKICVPNAGMPPGAQVDIYNFDHDVGQFLSIGPATVTEDGSMLCSNPGFGIHKAGWWGGSPPPPPTTKVTQPGVKITSASIPADSIVTQLSPSSCTGTFKLELLGPDGNLTLISTTRSGGSYTDSFNIPGLPEKTFKQVKATWVVTSNQTSQTVQSVFDYAFQNLGVYRHSQYNTPNETHETCGGPPVDTCFTTSACAYSQGMLKSIFKSQVDLNGSGTSATHGNIQPEGFCLNRVPPPSACQGRDVYRQNTKITPHCGGDLSNSTVAVGDGGALACGDNIFLAGAGAGHGISKTVTDRCPACTGKKQIDNFTTDGRCTNIIDLGNFVTIKLLN